MPSTCINHEEQVGDNTQVYYEVIPDKIQHTAENRDLDEVSTYSTTNEVKNINCASSAVAPPTTVLGIISCRQVNKRVQGKNQDEPGNMAKLL